MTLLPNLKLLIGGRYDFLDKYARLQLYDNSAGDFVGEVTQNSFYDDAFSPRVGIVYQPTEPISLYASYSRSFVPNDGRNRDEVPFPPTRGTQYEIGARAELFDSQLIANLAAYEITKTNVLTSDPNDPDFSIAAGEVTSRGIELDVSGEILPSWKIIASAYLNDAFVSEDDSLPEGDRLVNAPSSGASLWTTYEIQSGNLQGLGFGAGVFYVGDREALLPNEFEIPSYVRADAALFYRRDDWRVGLNFKNIFGTKYYESTGFWLYPGAPFTVQGTVSVQF